MKLERNFQINPALIGVVPLINVMFLVVLLFALASRFLLQSGFAVPLPTSSFVLTPSRQPQLVSITAVPVPAIYHGDRRITIEELGPRLSTVTGKDKSLIIKADRTTPWDILAQVASVAMEHGFSVVFATTPPTK